jgi:hypothetical protein
MMKSGRGPHFLSNLQKKSQQSQRKNRKCSTKTNSTNHSCEKERKSEETIPAHVEAAESINIVVDGNI